MLVDCDVATEAERKMLLAHQLVFGCHDSTMLQNLLALQVFDLELIFMEMKSQ